MQLIESTGQKLVDAEWEPIEVYEVVLSERNLRDLQMGNTLVKAQEGNVRLRVRVESDTTHYRDRIARKYHHIS